MGKNFYKRLSKTHIILINKGFLLTGALKKKGARPATTVDLDRWLNAYKELDNYLTNYLSELLDEITEKLVFSCPICNETNLINDGYLINGINSIFSCQGCGAPYSDVSSLRIVYKDTIINLYGVFEHSEIKALPLFDTEKLDECKNIYEGGK